MKYNRKAAVKLLIEKGCDVQLAKYNESNVLHLAAKKGDPEIVQMLVDAGHDVNTKNWGGNTALLVASRFGNKEAVSVLLNTSGCLVDDWNRLGHTALHYACFRGSRDIVEKLLSFGANPDARTYLNITPIMLASEQDHCSVVEVLTDNCSLSRKEKLYGAPVLHWAVASGCVRCVQKLIYKGASIYTYDQSGRSPLLQAVISNKPEILKILLAKHKYDDFSCGQQNCIILHVASYLGKIDCVNMLCETNKTCHLINGHDYFGETPLDLAVRAGQSQAVSLLVKFGAFTSKKLALYRKEKFTAKLSTEIEQNVDNLHIKPDTEAFMKSNVAPPNEQSHENFPCAAPTKCDASTVVNSITKVTKKVSLSPQLVNNSGHSNDDTNLKQLLSGNSEGEKSSTMLRFPLFKTYSPVKMSMIELLKSVSVEQMVAKEKFNFNSWLDNGPEAFVLKVVSLDVTEWLHNTMHCPWSLKELCRGKMRYLLGYRANEKVQLLPLPNIIKNYLNMKELESLDTEEIRIRNTRYYDVIDI